MLRAHVIPFVFLCACGNASPPASPAARVSDPEAPSASIATADAGATASSGVRVEVSESKGVTSEQLAPMVLPAKEPLKHCHNGAGGKINVRVTRKDNATNMSVEPGASLDPEARHCVLETLSALGLEETGGNVAGPGGRPSGFTSLISVSW
ncbi:MAG: hypothetical protein ABIP89_25480 [Polyangiaceae bacterium]